MKNIYNIALLSVAVLLGSCQAEQQVTEPSTNVDGGEKIVITASTKVDSKVNFAGDASLITLTWAEGDAFTIYDESGAKVGNFEYVGEDGLAIGNFVDDFETGVTLVDGETYTAVMPASDCATLEERNTEIAESISTQTIDDITSLNYLNSTMGLNSAFTYSATEGNKVTFAHEMSLIHLDLTMDSGVSPATIKVTDGGNSDATYTVTLPADCPRALSAYIAVAPREVTAAADITFSINDTYSETVSSAVNLAAGHFHNVTLSFVSVGWAKDYVNDLSIPAAANANLAVMGETLVVSTGSAQYLVDVESGEALGEASWSMDLGDKGAITSDDAGNLLLAIGAGAGETYTIYSTSSVDTAPTVLTTTENVYGATFGKKISVYGDITSDAIITVPMWYGANDQGFIYLRWVITGGVISEVEKLVATGVTPDSWNGNMDVCYATTDPTSGMYYTSAYSANEISAVNVADNACAGSVSGTLLDTNFNANCVDAVEVDGSKYVATLAGAFFTWGGAPTVYVYDVTSVASYPVEAAFTVGGSRFNSGGAGSGDVLMEASGSNINIFFIDALDGTLSYCQFSPAN